MAHTITNTFRTATWYYPSTYYHHTFNFGDWDERSGYAHIGAGNGGYNLDIPWYTLAWKNLLYVNSYTVGNNYAGGRMSSGSYSHPQTKMNAEGDLMLLGMRLTNINTLEWVEAGWASHWTYQANYYHRCSDPAVMPFAMYGTTHADSSDAYATLRVYHDDATGGKVHIEFGLGVDPWAYIPQDMTLFFTDDITTAYRLDFVSYIFQSFNQEVQSGSAGKIDLSLGSIQTYASSQVAFDEGYALDCIGMMFECEMSSGYRTPDENSYVNNVIATDGVLKFANLPDLTYSYIDDYILITDVPAAGDHITFDKQLPLSGFKWEIEVIRYTQTTDLSMQITDPDAPNYDSNEVRIGALIDYGLFQGADSGPAEYRAVITAEPLNTTVSGQVLLTMRVYPENGTIAKFNRRGHLCFQRVVTWTEDPVNTGYFNPISMEVLGGWKIRRVTWRTYYETLLIQPIVADMASDFQAFNDITGAFFGHYAKDNSQVSKAYFFHKEGITGGGVNDLDGINPNNIEGSGASLTEGSVTLVTTGTTDAILYVAEEDPTAVSDPPNVVIPVTNPGDWAWKKVAINEYFLDQFSISGTEVTCNSSIDNLLIPVFNNSVSGHIETPYFSIDELQLAKTADSETGTMTILNIKDSFKKVGFDS